MSLPHRTLRAGAPVLALTMAGLLVGGCDAPRRALGLEKAPPNEFEVVARAPLSLPPDYRLRPPNPGAAGMDEQVVAEQARQAVFGIEPAAGAESINKLGVPLDPGATTSPGEATLLARAGTNGANPDIRTLVDRESAVIAAADETFLDRLLNWRGPPTAGTVVDADAEARRLRENQALGVPATAGGDTPVIEHRRRAPLEGLF